MAEENNAPQEEQKQINIDYDKLAQIIAGKQQVTEESVLKGYFKQQGLSGDEMSQAIEMFKKDRASKQPDIQGLTKQAEDATQRALMAETKVMAMTMASELGVNQKTIPYLLKLADVSSVIKDGNIDSDKLKESLNEVLKDLPQLKQTAEEKPNGFKIGSDGKEQNSATNDDLARIFGVKMK